VKLHLVITIQTGGAGDDMISDIILITDDEQKAKETFLLVKAGESIEGLDYDYLAEYDDVALIEKDLNEISFGGE
jgi:hypothetical protein